MKMKSTGGFTLVELIVVIAILAILAAVAVPAYTGYIEKAQEASDITSLDAIKTASMAVYATTGSVDALTIKINTETGKVTEVLIGSTAIYGSNVDTSNEKTAKMAEEFENLYMTDIANVTLSSKEYKVAGVAYWDGSEWSNAIPTTPATSTPSEE